MIARYLAAFVITFLLTRVANKLFARTLTAKKAALISFALVSVLALAISTQTIGLLVGIYTYIPCLIIILAVDLYKENNRTPIKSNL